MKIFILILMLSTFFVPAALSEISKEKADSLSYELTLEEGIDAFYKGNWGRASLIFHELQYRSAEDGRAYFFDSMIPFWKYFFGGNSEKEAKIFLERSRKAITVSQEQLRENPHDTTIVLMLSGLYGYRSLVAASEKQYKTAIQSGMTGFKYTKQLLALDSDDPKALIGKGMFYYMLGSIPKGLKWMANIAGMSGDTQAGFRALEQAARSESYVSNDAKMILAYLYERENEPRKALDYLQDLTHTYPENIIFQYNQARLFENCERLSEAKEKYRLVVAMETDDLQVLKKKSRSRLQKL